MGLHCYNLYIYIIVAPKIEQDQRFRGGEHEVRVGSTLALPLHFTGIPTPKVSWYRNGLPLMPMQGHVNIDSSEAYTTMNVLGVEKDEGGRYTCRVENCAGSAEAQFNVRIKGMCKYLPDEKYIYSLYSVIYKYTSILN